MLKACEVACKIVAHLASGLKKCTSLAKLSVHAGVVSVTAIVTVTDLPICRTFLGDFNLQLLPYQ